MANQQTITICVHCFDLPGANCAGRNGVRLGVQKGKEVIDDISADAAEATFTLEFRVERNPQTGNPNFLGPYAQGPSHERFFYLCWGESKHGFWGGFSRVKIHLKRFDWPTIESVLKQSHALKAKLRMTDKKGGPICASVREDAIEWTIEPGPCK